jgi:transglutaminase-like putative cysteine protease
MSKILFDKSIKRTWDWVSVILLVLLMMVAAARLIATLWTLDLNLVMMVTVLGAIIGLALGKSIFRRFWLIFFPIAYGFIIIVWQLGLTADPDLVWHDRLVNLWGRLGLIIQDLLSKQPVTDNLLFLLLMAALFWFISVFSGIILVREGNPWKVVIPAGIAAFVINTFDPLLLVRSLYLAVYLLFALFLVARLFYINNTVRWNRTRTHTPPDMGFELSRVALILSMVLVFFAWNLPVLADAFTPVADLWQSTSQPWLSLKDRFSFMFASLKASATSIQNFYSSTLPLGLSSPLSDQVVMEVEAPASPPDGTRYYWEARTYDTYRNNIWSSTIQNPHDLTSSSSDLNQPGVDQRTAVTFTVHPYQNITNLYAPPEVLWTNLSTQAFMNENSDGTVNFSALMSSKFVRPGEQYTVKSAMDSVTVLQLKNAGTDYPSWVTNTYLQLPNNITPRTKELANTIAEGLSNPYDIANAVTNYLRRNIQYDLSISQPPANQERIDWFLFDNKKGFCNYYASAEVILLRSLGIPARMAVGFAEGQQENAPLPQLPPGVSRDNIQSQIENSTFVVRQKDAHAWPEVYFPELGWVIFEPTSGQNALSRPSGEVAASNSQTDPGRGNPVPTPQELGSEPQLPTGDATKAGNAKGSIWTSGFIFLFIIAQIVIGATIIIVWQYFRGFRIYAFLERISVGVPETMVKGLNRIGIPPPMFLTNWIFYMKLPSPSRSYMEINHAIERLGQQPETNATPSERADLLVSLLPKAEDPAHQLIKEYQASVYSAHHANANLARESAVEIRNLSWRAWLDRTFARFKNIFKRSSAQGSAKI